MLQSLPAWGAWVEMMFLMTSCLDTKSLPAWGAWVEIRPRYLADHPWPRRSPHGERGLKFFGSMQRVHTSRVAPRMGSVG